MRFSVSLQRGWHLLVREEKGKGKKEDSKQRESTEKELRGRRGRPKRAG